MKDKNSYSIPIEQLDFHVKLYYLLKSCGIANVGELLEAIKNGIIKKQFRLVFVEDTYLRNLLYSLDAHNFLTDELRVQIQTLHEKYTS